MRSDNNPYEDSEYDDARGHRGRRSDHARRSEYEYRGDRRSDYDARRSEYEGSRPGSDRRPPERARRSGGARRPEYDHEPHQRLPEYVYRRRRIMLAVIALLVLALVFWGVHALLTAGDDNPQNTAETSALPTSIGGKPQLLSPAPEAPGSGAADTAKASASAKKEAAAKSPEPESAAEESPAQNPVRSGKCTIDALEVKAQTDAGDYPPDQLPVFHISITNPTDTDCVIDTAKDSLRFEVYSMKDNSLVWVDTDCNDPVTSGKETFKPQDTRVFEAQWSRTQSAPNQCTAGERVSMPAGPYYLHGVIGNNASEAVPFNLGA